jgi:hypothetical protein
VEELGGYRELAPAARGLGSLVFVGMLALTALLERLQFQLRATETSVWWASNGRDVVNAFALGAMSLGLRVIGFTGPISLAIAATVVVLLSALQASLEKHRWSGVLSVLAAFVLGAPVIVLPEAVHRLFVATILFLFGQSGSA